MGIVNQIKTQQKNRSIIEQVKAGRSQAINEEKQNLQKESDRLNSPTTIAKETAKGSVKELTKGALTFIKSALYAPVDIARGAMGKPAVRDNTSFPTIQAQAADKTSDVFDLKKSPAMATAELTGQTVAGASDVLGATGLLRKGTKLTEQGISKADELYKTYKSGKETIRAGQEATKIAETISPSLTSKEVKLAQTQNRLYPGKEPGIFKSGTADKIATSQKTADATRTIQQNIPGASKMKPSDLYTAVDEKIGTTAKNLRPQMEKIPIKPQTVEEITNKWDDIKRAQIENAPATEEVNVIKRQKKFESLLQKSGNRNHADLWDTRIAYDNSVPDAVKKANSLSSESLQLQKAEWLENRRILTEAMDAIDSPEMRALSDLYEAKNNLLSKTKLGKAELSKLRQAIKKHPQVAGALKLVLGVEAFRRLTGIDITPN